MIESVETLEGSISGIADLNGELSIDNIYIEPRVQEKSVAPTTEVQEVVPDETYTGLSKVTVGAIEDEDLIPENIKQGVNILGVEGNFVGGKYAPRNANGRYFRNLKVTELDYEINNLDTTNFTSFYEMFYGCSNLKYLDLSGFNTKNVTDMSDMFDSCNKLSYLNLSNFNTSNVTNMTDMFYNVWTLQELDLSSFDTSNVTNMSYMFSGCNALKHLDIRNFTFDKVINYNNMFRNNRADCLIIVKGQTEKDWITSKFSTLTNVKTAEEYENGI